MKKTASKAALSLQIQLLFTTIKASVVLVERCFVLVHFDLSGLLQVGHVEMWFFLGFATSCYVVATFFDFVYHFFDTFFDNFIRTVRNKDNEFVATDTIG